MGVVDEFGGDVESGCGEDIFFYVRMYFEVSEKTKKEEAARRI